MSTVTKEVRLILCDAGNNNNKFWTGKLYDNDDVFVEWGRIGMASQSKMHPGRGEDYLEEKEREKLKKGYTPLKTIATDGKSPSIVVEHRDLNTIVKKDIQFKSPELQKLIDRLVKANIHHITTSSQIKYNANTGLFSTPLGIVTQDGINEARKLLTQIKTAYKLENPDLVRDWVNMYMRIIPQNIGMKFEIKSIFGTDELLIKQSDLLDSLEASYQALQTTPTTTNDNAPKIDKVFNVDLDVVTDGRELDHIRRKFRDSKNANHVSYRLDVRQVFKVHINQVRAAFLARGIKVGNVMELWHGTKQANLLSILKTGLKISPPSTAHVTGKMFGNGLYFSDQSTKSLNYAAGYWDGTRESNCFMFLCDVAMGNCYVPDRSGGYSLPRSGYDSTFAKADRSGVRNNEMIVYREDQCDLKYLIEFA